MRWEALFDDMAAQLDQWESRELAGEAAERVRAERAKVQLVQRLLAHRGEVILTVAGAAVQGLVEDAAPQWLLLSAGAREVLIPVAAIDGVTGLTRQAAPEAGVVLRRLGLGHAVRAVARDRSEVQVSQVSGGVLTGTIDRVGADHFDLACHQPGQWRRVGNVNSIVTVPFTQVAQIWRATTGVER